MCFSVAHSPIEHITAFSSASPSLSVSPPMAPSLRQNTIRGSQRGAFSGRHQRNLDHRLESIEGSSSSNHDREAPSWSKRTQEEIGLAQENQRGKRIWGPRKSTISHSKQPTPRNFKPLLVQEASGEDTDVWIMDLDEVWTRVPDAEYPVIA